MTAAEVFDKLIENWTDIYIGILFYQELSDIAEHLSRKKRLIDNELLYIIPKEITEKVFYKYGIEILANGFKEIVEYLSTEPIILYPNWTIKKCKINEKTRINMLKSFSSKK